MSPSVNAEGGFDLSVERVSGLEPLVLVRVDIDDARLTILVRGFGDVPDGITMLHQVGHLSVVVPNHGLFKNARHDMSPMRFDRLGEKRSLHVSSHPANLGGIVVPLLSILLRRLISSPSLGSIRRPCLIATPFLLFLLHTFSVFHRILESSPS